MHLSHTSPCGMLLLALMVKKQKTKHELESMLKNSLNIKSRLQVLHYI